jgi:hypothetical protein
MRTLAPQNVSRPNDPFRRAARFSGRPRRCSFPRLRLSIRPSDEAPFDGAYAARRHVRADAFAECVAKSPYPSQLRQSTSPKRMAQGLGLLNAALPRQGHIACGGFIP